MGVIDQGVIDAVEARSRGMCEAETPLCRGVAEAFHHRKLRRHGDHSVDNILHVCGLGACHTYVHEHVAESYERGWLLRSTDEVTPYRGR